MTNQDHLVREAEARAYAHYDMSSVDRTVTVESSLGPVDVRVCVFGEPTDETPVVLLHGIASVTVIAASLLPYLRGRQVYAVDWPGHGLSGASVLPRGTRFRTQAVAVLRSLLDALGLDRVDLVGHSMGAQISLYSALDLGPRVRRLALLGAPGAGLPGVRPITAMKLAAIPGLGPALLAAPMSERVFIRGNEVALGKGVLDDVPADVLRAAHLLAGRRSNARSIASFFRTLLKRGKVRPGIALDATELARITQPVLMAWGDADVFLTPDAATEAISAIPDLHLVRIPAAGHAPWLEDPVTVGIAIATHLGTAEAPEQRRAPA